MTFLDQTGLSRLWQHIVARLNGFVQVSRKINGKELSNDVVLTAADVGADVAGAAAEALASANAYTDSEIADLINSAPTTLDTLGEIATAMQENADVVAALDTAIGSKASTSDLTSHTSNSTVHITASERTNWDGAVTHIDDTAKHITDAERTKWNAAKTHADTEHVLSVNGSTGVVTVSAVPSCTTSNNGQFLRVVDGVAAWSTIPNAEEATF